MRQSGNHSAFTIVEALVATAVVGIAGASLAVSLVANGTLRTRASARTAAAGLIARRLAGLAVRPCSAPDTGGVEIAAGAVDAWTARREDAGWVYADSIGAGAVLTVRADGVVTCRP